ncbi:SRPBCC family protein [Streptomyces sp. 8K308]|uniref:SRPBCC family protein n=1 Tax=Streptomyces sp. 8K308 TaxID=2530388 RepID=UPI0010479551|nr:SRPBCC family protein [Streptomyces sp. 8K308]TDC25491.1 SRPBCC family protein [Streptomyces sp. 8K308]
MATESRHIAQSIARPAGEVYAFVSQPANVPAWAAGLGSSVAEVGEGEWFAESPMGPVRIAFAPTNEYGVVDHDVMLPTGDVVHNPMRVIPDGADACEVVFTVRRLAGMSDEEFDRDAGQVAADLTRLREILEGDERRG